MAPTGYPCRTRQSHGCGVDVDSRPGKDLKSLKTDLPIFSHEEKLNNSCLKYELPSQSCNHRSQGLLFTWMSPCSVGSIRRVY